MPKRGVGRLNNLGGHAERNTKRTRIRKEQKKRREGKCAGELHTTHLFFISHSVRSPRRFNGLNLAGIPFLNSAFSPPLQDLFNNLPTAPPIDTVNPPFWLEADLFLDAPNIIRQRDSLLLPRNVCFILPENSD